MATEIGKLRHELAYLRTRVETKTSQTEHGRLAQRVAALEKRAAGHEQRADRSAKELDRKERVAVRVLGGLAAGELVLLAAVAVALV